MTDLEELEWALKDFESAVRVNENLWSPPAVRDALATASSDASVDRARQAILAIFSRTQGNPNG